MVSYARGGHTGEPRGTRETKSVANQFLVRAALQGTQLEDVECYGSTCAIRFQSTSAADLDALQEQLAKRAFEGAYVFSADRATFASTVHQMSTDLTLVGEAVAEHGRDP